MRAVVQRTIRSKVTVEGQEVGSSVMGLTVFIGVGKEDSELDAVYVAEKVANLRIFEDETGKMNRSLMDVCGQVLAVSQFTLYGDCRKGRRPSFDLAAPADKAKKLYEVFVDELRKQGLFVSCGRFQAEMIVSLENQGPVTMLIDSKRQF